MVKNIDDIMIRISQHKFLRQPVCQRVNYAKFL